MVSSLLRFVQDFTENGIGVSRILEQFTLHESHRGVEGTLVWTLLVILLGALVLHWKFRQRLDQRSDKLPLPPGTCGLPFLGETLSFLAARRANKPERFFLVIQCL
jgi:hypothetical protein